MRTICAVFASLPAKPALFRREGSAISLNPGKFVSGRNCLVLLKRAGADILGIARFGEVKYLERTDPSWNDLRQIYQDGLCGMDNEFWEKVADSWFGTLIWFDHFKQLPAIECDKNDRRGWVGMKRASDQLALGFE